MYAPGTPVGAFELMGKSERIAQVERLVIPFVYHIERLPEAGAVSDILVGIWIAIQLVTENGSGTYP